MPYATRQQIEDAAGGNAALVAATDLNEANVVDENVLARVQAQVESFVGGKVRIRYNEADVLANVDPELAAVAAREVVYRLRRDVRRIAMSDEERLDHEERLRYLDSIADGSTRLADPQPAKSTNVRGVYVYNDDAVSRQKLRDGGF